MASIRALNYRDVLVCETRKGRAHFNVIFNKTLWDAESEIAEDATEMILVGRADTVPFPPLPGMGYHWRSGISAVPKDIRWEFAEGHFVCTMPDDFPGDGIDTPNLEHTIRHLERDGWKLIVRRPV